MKHVGTIHPAVDNLGTTAAELAVMHLNRETVNVTPEWLQALALVSIAQALEQDRKARALLARVLGPR